MMQQYHLIFHSTQGLTLEASYKLLNHTFHYDLWRYFFYACIVNVLNNLPNSDVNASMVNAFKAWLDKLWSHQAVKFDFTTYLTGIGNQSEDVIK